MMFPAPTTLTSMTQPLFATTTACMSCCIFDHKTCSDKSHSQTKSPYSDKVVLVPGGAGA